MEVNERITTRHKRLDYRLFNDESDEEASPEDRIPESVLAASFDDFFVDTPDYEIFPSESASPMQQTQQLLIFFNYLE
ncbi:hypothetical protein POJ06DRAFT_270891 [Lipomyces tetrasporus]|uniref:Uncharacterized protein n=1 Tax=Lipomyces tetrasporus TaxID=54092 RepID=A0AAD7VRF9_9ASCO|nr:uncharacterized protein POJ06DRAFT_270891 [Lipomyces tetrasporus]KAJ8098080.1 hypothetical protein POJ06DRAFT_270891 [Lipomyces tetrasporus]